MVKWSSDDVVKWMDDARENQQKRYNLLGDREWDYIEKNNKWALEMKVGFALYGEPKDNPSTTMKYGYKPDQFAEICKIRDLIYKESGEFLQYINIAFIFVDVKMHEKQIGFPIFRIKSKSREHVFLDPIGRVYKNWKDYCTNNKLPKCLLCYPENGIYTATEGLVKLTYDTSPACKLPSTAGRFFDKVSFGVVLGSTAVAAVGIFVPVAAPLMIAATIGGTSSGLYGAARGANQLIDRSTHSQSIGLKNSEARNSWLTILGGGFGVGSTVAVASVAKIAASGGVLGTASRCVVNFFNFGSLVVNGASIGNGFAVLVKRFERKELTALDVVQFSASVFFFSNALINVKTANTMIRDVQEGIKSDFTKDLSKRRMKAFNRVVKESSGEGVIQDNARIIKGISNIGSKDEFFRLVIKAQKLDKATTKLTQSGKIEVGGQLFVDTRAGVSHPINYGQNSNNFSWSANDAKCAFDIAYETQALIRAIYNEKKRIEISEGVQFTLEGEVLDGFADLISRYFPSSIEYMLEKGGFSSHITEAENFARDRGCTTEEDFISFSEFLCIYKRNKLKQMERSYQEEKSGLMSQIGNDFNESEFDKKWNIEDSNDREGSFLRVISEELRISNEDLKKEYDMYNRDVQRLNQSGEVKFSSKYRALNQFYRCFVVDLDETMTLEEYFQIIRNTVQDEQFKVGTQNSGEGRTFLLYYDPSVPVIVNLLKNKDGLFFESTIFKALDSSYFNMWEKGGFSSLIAEAENFARGGGCTTEEDFISFSEFLCIYKRNKLKQMERSYQEEKSGLMSQIGDDFNETEFDRKWNIEDSNDREGSFLRVISEELRISNEDLKNEYDMYNRDVQRLNQSGDVKFSSEYRALNQFYRCFVVDLDETMTLEDYFQIIRNTVQDEQFKVGTQNSVEDRTFLLYYDPSVPVIVNLLKNKDGLFFESTIFKALDSSYFNMWEKGGFSSLIAEAENFARDGGCTTEEDFISFSEFLCIYRRNKLKQMERSYQEKKFCLMSKFGDDFNETEFDKEWKIEDSNDREGSFLRVISEKLRISNEDLKNEYDMYNRDVQHLNQSGEVKFSSEYRALNQFYRCFVISTSYRLTLKGYFRIIRRTVQDEQFKVGTQDAGEDRTFLLYHHPDFPLLVMLLKNKDGLFFESTVFQHMKDFENEL